MLRKQRWTERKNDVSEKVSEKKIIKQERKERKGREEREKETELSNLSRSSACEASGREPANAIVTPKFAKNIEINTKEIKVSEREREIFSPLPV